MLQISDGSSRKTKDHHDSKSPDQIGKLFLNGVFIFLLAHDSYWSNSTLPSISEQAKVEIGRFPTANVANWITDIKNSNDKK